MFISVQFGYNQAKLFNINCQVAPLLDAVNTQAYLEMIKTVKKREEFFYKEVAQFKKKEAAILKQLDAFDKPPTTEKEGQSNRSGRVTGRRLTKKEQEEADKKKKEEEEKLRALEEERLRKEEEEE
jgi:hypothetical protein